MPPLPLLVFDGLGWLGAALVIAPYALVSVGRMAGTALAYRALNVAGGALLLVNTAYHRAFPSMVVNVIWTGIALYALTATRRAAASAHGRAGLHGSL